MGRRKRVKNKKRFTAAIVIALIIIAVIVFAVIKLAGKISQGNANAAGDNSDNGSQEQIVPGGEQLSPQELEKKNAELARSKEVSDAQQKINEAVYPINEVEDFDLILVNKTHALSDNYKPDDLVTVERFVKGVGNDDTHKLRQVAADALNAMFDAALEDGIELRLRTGFRSYSYQTSLYNSYVKNHGEKEADTFSARPGNSEHQSGLCCDVGGKSQNFDLSYSFGDTVEGQWVAEHAHEFGFIIRYTDGKTDANGKRQPGEITGYVFEPWHIRYVGEVHAEKIHELGITLEEYLGIMDAWE